MDEKIRLRREINLPYATSVMTGVIIGSGIFVSPVSITRNCGSIALSLIIWIVSGLFTLGQMLCYAELGTIYPKAGGEYAFIKIIMSPAVAFVTVWFQFWVGEPTFYAILSLTTSNYLLKPLYPDCDIPHMVLKLLSVWILVTVAVVNTFYVRHVSKVQVVFTIVKITALLLIIGLGIIQLAKGHTAILDTGFEGSTSDPGDIAIALVSGLFTFGGGQYLFNILEELKRPERILPQACVLSMLTIILLYTMANVAYFTVMTPAELMQSEAVALTFAERTIGRGAVVFPILVACSAIGALNGSLLGGSRLYFAASRDELFPSAIATMHVKYRTPVLAIWSVCGVAVLYIAVGDVVMLIEYLAFTNMSKTAALMGCVIYLRVKKPHLPRSIKMPLFVPILVLSLIFLTFILGMYREPYRNGIGILITLSGLPAYLLCVRWKNKPAAYHTCQRTLTCFLQKLLLLLPED